MSTTQTICNIQKKIIKNIDCSLCTCCVFLDLTKTFDYANHAILLHKMEHNFGVRGLLLQLLKSYLSNRYQYTVINNYKSSMLKVSCGIPQESSLKQLLFLFYMNDLPQVNRFDTTLFSDNTLLMLSDINVNNLENTVNNELHKINCWLEKNKLSLNYTKTNYILICKRLNFSCIAEIQSQFNKTSLK